MSYNPITVWTLILLHQAIFIAGRQIYVSHSGRDYKHCGSTQSTPCKSVAQAVAESSKNDVIELEKADHPYTVKPLSGHFVNITHTLMIRSESERTKLNCTDGQAGMFRVFDPNYGGNSSATKLVTLTLENIELRDCVGRWKQSSVIRLVNAAVSIHNCRFTHVGTALHHPSLEGVPCDTVTISVTSSELHTCGFVKPHIPCIVLMNCNTTKAIITDTLLQSASVRLQANLNMLLQMSNVTWFGYNVRGPLLDVELAQNQSIISLTNTTISSHTGRTSPVVIAAEHRVLSPTIRFHNVAFINNTFTKTLGGALALVVQSEKKPVTLNIYFVGCHFSGNSALDAGGALYIEGVDNVAINHCIFEDNVAKDGGAILIAGSTNVSMYNDTFINNQATGKSKHNYFGVGGGLYILQSDLMLTKCTFKDNMAEFKGQAIHATAMTNAYITFNDFMTTKPFFHVVQRSEVYLEQSQSTDRQSTMLTVQLIENRFSDNETSTQHGLYNIRTTGQTDISQNEACCPPSHYLDRLSQPQYDLPGFDTGSSIDYLWCAACPVGTYSLQQQCLPADHGATNEDKEKRCLKCPDMAKCLGDGHITAPRNYWGSVRSMMSSEVRFFLCPAEYCNPDECHSIKCCSNNRTGVLCGKCKLGHQLNVGTGSCILKSNCHQTSTVTMLWAAAFGFLYLTVTGLFVIVMSLIQKHISPLNLADSLLNATWSCENDGGATAINGQQIADQSGESEGLGHLESDQGSDSFEPSLAALDNTETQRILAVLNEETQTSAQVSLRMSASTQVILITDLPYVCCVFWMLMQLLEDAYWPSYGKGIQNTIIRIILDLINLRPVYYILTAPCIDGDAADILKTLLTLMSFGTMIVVLVLIMICGHIILKLISLVRNASVCHHRAHFDAVLCKMFIILVMLIYLPVLKSCLQLIYCIQLHSESWSVLFINGALPCYQWWQWLVIVFIITNLAPIGLMVWISLPLVQNYIVTHVQFITGMACPLVTIIYWTWRHFHLTCRWLSPGESYLRMMQSDMFEANQDHFMATDVICTFFIRPFTPKPHQFSSNSSKDGSTAWIIFTFVRVFIVGIFSIMLNHMPHVRCIVMVTLLFVMTVMHIVRQPYHTRLINQAETGILVILTVLAVISLDNSLAYVTGIELLQYIHNTGYASNLMFIIITSVILIGYLATLIVNALKNKRAP